jgi:zinc protease
MWLALAVASVLCLSQPAAAFEIQQLRTPKGLNVWLVEEHSIPIIAMRFAFRGGAAQDPNDRQGLMHLLSGTLDEGAGDLDSQAFQLALSRQAVSMRFEAGRDEFFGRFKTLTQNRDAAFELLRLALNEPRFDAGPVGRIADQISETIRRNEQDPETVAITEWMSHAFGEHPYGRNPEGTIEGIAAVTGEDLRALTQRLFARDELYIAVVGDVDAETISALVDQTFGDLPEQNSMPGLAPAEVLEGPSRVLVDMNVPQTAIQFGHAGILRNDPDFIPAYIMNHILGGGGLTSRLTDEIREKRGLTYSVYSYLSPLAGAGLFLGVTSTQNERAGETIAIIEQEVARMAETGPTAEELNDAKLYLTGSYALRFDTSSKIAGQLLGIQLEDLGSDYIERRNDLINAITVDDVQRMARELLIPGGLIFSIVGRPVGVEPASAAQ